MIRPAVAALLRRRGSTVTWLHAVPANAASFNGITGGPPASIGGPRLATGDFGETYASPVTLIAYFSHNTTSWQQLGYGNVDVGDAQLDRRDALAVEQQRLLVRRRARGHGKRLSAAEFLKGFPLEGRRFA